MKKIFMTLIAACIIGTSMAQNNFTDNLAYRVRLGYSLGGTAPVGLPATIRHLNSYTLMPNLQVGVEAEKPVTDKLGVLIGLRLENKGMQTDAEVKNYHIAFDRGGSHLEGQFTGNVHTKVTEWMFTIPVQATYNLSQRFKIKAGPYVSFVTGRDFSGYAHDGYLRVGNATGPRVNIGSSPDQRGSYDFTEHMRRFQVGVSAGIDWNFYQQFGAYFDLNWGLNGIHHSNFKTIQQTLYPIFGTIGLSYKI